MTALDYIPHMAVTALAAVVAWVGKDHFHRDDARFKYLADSISAVGAKLDTAIGKQADNHAEILKLLVQPVRERRIDA